MLTFSLKENVLITDEQNEVLKKFLNSCKSAKKSIKFWPIAQKDSAEQFKLFSDDQIFDFILNSIEILDAEKNQFLNYTEGGPIVYEYVFYIKETITGKLGCLAFYHEPEYCKSRIKWQVKSLHYDITGKKIENYKSNEQIDKEASK